MSTQKHDAIMIGRAKNALLKLFEQRLSVPKIYLDAEWEGTKVDVLAIDRAGVGDVSVAFVIEATSSSSAEGMERNIGIIEKLKLVPAHFKYLALVPVNAIGLGTSSQIQALDRVLSDMPQTFAPDGVGRIGNILVDLNGDRPSISVPISAERFRSNQHIYDLADMFASSHTADFEVRP